MISFYGCLALMLLIFILVLGLLIYYTRSGLCAFACISLAFISGFMVNQDILHWFQHEKEQQSIAQAKNILNNPNAIQNLIEKLQQRVKNYPDDAKAWFLLGRVCAGDGQWEKAHDALLQAYRLEPDNIKSALFYVETIWHTQNKITAHAREVLLKILAQEPNQPDALMLMANEARQRQCPKEAIVYLEALRNLMASEEELRVSLDDAILKAQQEDNSKCQPVGS